MFGIADTDIFAFTNAYVYKITNEIFSYFPLKQLFDNKYILLPYPMYKAWTSNSHIHEENQDYVYGRKEYRGTWQK